MAVTDDKRQGVSDAPHDPVLINEVLAALSPVSDKRIIDGTFGAGGYSRRFLDAGANVIGLDRDPNVICFADELAAQFGDEFTFVQTPFSDLGQATDLPIDAIVLDIGVSSMQLDEAERGFSFLRDGPLDMRMSQDGLSAADIINAFDEADIASILFVFGEERQSRRIAKAIVEARKSDEIQTTGQLASLIERTIGRKPGSSHPATKSFQALRIAVNGEFDQLVQALFAAEQVLKEGGVLAIVTFHSLEDRIVKRFFSGDAAQSQQSRHLPQANSAPKTWHPVAKAVKPSKAEVERNPRARSAILRSAVRSSAAPREFSVKGLGVPQAHVRGVA